MKRMALFLILLSGIYCALDACDMSAVITGQGVTLADYHAAATDANYIDYTNPVDYLAYVMTRSNSAVDNDGYGILYYPQDSFQLDADNYWYKYVASADDINHVYYTGHFFESENQQDTFDDALDNIVRADANASIVMCHARNASANPFAPGNHPFRMNLNNRTYTFMHNGFVSTEARTFMINETNLTHNNWFDFTEPNYPDFANSAYPSCWIDSEVLFNYLMCQIEANDFNVYTGLSAGLKKLEQYMKLSANVVNFVFSDGQKLYAFCSAPVAGINSGYKLSYKQIANEFCAVRSGLPTVTETPVRQYELVVLSRDKKPERYPDFLKQAVEGSLHTSLNSANHDLRGEGQELILNHTDISISFNLRSAARIKLNVYNPKGQLIRKLMDSNLPVGAHKVIWNGLNDRGKASVRGIYFIEIQNGRQRTMHKVIYLK
jgi:hypothetical protein